jgi:hypothetical protein
MKLGGRVYWMMLSGFCGAVWVLKPQEVSALILTWHDRSSYLAGSRCS